MGYCIATWNCTFCKHDCQARIWRPAKLWPTVLSDQHLLPLLYFQIFFFCSVAGHIHTCRIDCVTVTVSSSDTLWAITSLVCVTLFCSDWKLLHILVATLLHLGLTKHWAVKYTQQIIVCSRAGPATRPRSCRAHWRDALCRLHVANVCLSGDISVLVSAYGLSGSELCAMTRSIFRKPCERIIRIFCFGCVRFHKTKRS